MSDISVCPNCQTEIKGGVFKSNDLLLQKSIDVINFYSDNPQNGYCGNCGKDLYKNAELKMDAEKESLKKILNQLIHFVPVISTHSPFNWDYSIIGMVTGQSATGTGVITEFTSSFTDLFGAQSSRHNQKLQQGENLCFAQLRKKALDLGGNAVIATDIDYSEVGSGKGILMVCMAGTAINLKNLEVLPQGTSDRLNQINEKQIRLNKILSMRPDTAF